MNGQPAAIVGSFHACPMTTNLVPHVGGPLVMPDGREVGGVMLGNEGHHLNHVGALDQSADQGTTVLQMDGGTLQIGDAVIIGNDGKTSEIARVADKGSVILDRPLEFDHPAGTVVLQIPDLYAADVVALADAPVVLGGSFVGGPPGLGINFGVYTGGPAQGLPLAAPLAASFWITHQGNFLGYLAGSPAFVNQPFIDHFAAGIPPNTPLIVLTPGAG